VSTRFVQIKALGSKLVLPKSVIDFRYTGMYKKKKLKKSSSRKPPKELGL
jgi:hypothetical protein